MSILRRRPMSERGATTGEAQRLEDKIERFRITLDRARVAHDRARDAALEFKAERDALRKALVAFFEQVNPPPTRSDGFNNWLEGYTEAVDELRAELEKAGAEIEGPK